MKKLKFLLRWKGYLFATVFLILVIPCVKVNAENVSHLFLCYDYNGESYEALGTCNLHDGNVVACTIATGNEESYSNVREKTNNISFKYLGTYLSTLAVWQCNDSSLSKSYGFYTIGNPVKDEGVTAIYLSTENNVSIKNTSTSITESKTEGNSVYLEFDAISDSTFTSDYPGQLINSNNECVGIIVSNHQAIPLVYKEDVFNGSSGDDSESTEKTTDSDKDSKGTTEASANNNSSDSDDKTGSGYSYIFIAAIIGAIIGLIIRKSWKKPKPEVTNTNVINPEVIPPKPVVKPVVVEDQGKTEKLPDPPTPPTPITPPQPPEKKPKKDTFLYIRSGHNAGQAYPIKDYKLVIGRESKCTIRYPDDYPGVSGTHASIYRKNGKIYLRDEHSSYGTFLVTENGSKQISASMPEEIHTGSKFYLASPKNMIQVVEAATNK